MIRKVKVKDIRPNPFQARKTIDAEATKSLAEEIGKVGLWPGALRGREKNGHVELCFGHRRLEAVKVLGWKEVDCDVVKLSDEDMSLQALIENLQREGLNDADRGDGIAAYIRLKTGIQDLSVMFGLGGKNKQESSDSYGSLLSARDELCKLLGLSDTRIKELLRIAGLDEEVKQPIREQKIAGKSALAAYNIGAAVGKGKQAVKAIAEKELGFRAMMAIGERLHELPEDTEESKAVKDKVRERFAKGEIATGDDVVTKARQFKGQSAKKRAVPPDLIEVMRAWTERAHRWAGELEQVAPYIDYIDTEPKVAERWRAAVKTLIEKLDKFT